MLKLCKQCGKELVGRNKRVNVFCNNICQSDYRYRKYIDDWLSGKKSGGRVNGTKISNYVRRYLKETKQDKCELCGWTEINKHTGKVPVEIDHIDGHWENNRPENLRLLCPNCHSLTATYRGRNKGNGRPNRS